MSAGFLIFQTRGNKGNVWGKKIKTVLLPYSTGSKKAAEGGGKARKRDFLGSDEKTVEFFEGERPAKKVGVG